MDIWHMTNGDAAVLLGMYRDRVFSGVMPCRLFGSSERGRPENTGRVQVAWDGLNFDVKRIEVYVPDVLSMDYHAVGKKTPAFRPGDELPPYNHHKLKNNLPGYSTLGWPLCYDTPPEDGI